MFEVECFARRLRSELDPVMNLYTAEGRSIAGNDDSRGPDSYIRFSVPADGEYIVRVTDHLAAAGGVCLSSGIPASQANVVAGYSARCSLFSISPTNRYSSRQPVWDVVVRKSRELQRRSDA